ncbi:MAG: hypothetical protein JWN13_6978 [Betaproteobacteria bacterium]|jgi:hypothetical protein|nr:hypothetical protein [Betaproteobacteria bacterium]MEA3155398.1 hypothetical protein [Betaproteobacteria bacterium]
MEQSNQTAFEQLSDEVETTSAGLPKRYIPWIPLIALAQVLVTITIFSEVIAPYVGHEEPVAAIHDSTAS